jgi:site-specific DNA recombinase
MEDLKRYSLSPDKIRAYLNKADKVMSEKANLLQAQEHELEKTQQEMARTYKLYQEGQLDTGGFGRFYKPLEERRKQLEDSLPKIQAEIDLCKVNNLSAEEVGSEIQNLYQHWPSYEPEAKRAIVEAITERIVISKEEVIITLCYIPSSGDMAKRWRRGRDSNPR